MGPICIGCRCVFPSIYPWLEIAIASHDTVADGVLFYGQYDFLTHLLKSSKQLSNDHSLASTYYGKNKVY